MDFLNAVVTYMRRHRMAPRESRVLLAVSGGRDSMAMMEALRRLRKSLRIELGVAHIDHGLRESSGRDLAFVREKAKVHGLPFHHRKVGVLRLSGKNGRGVEDTARLLRYRALRSLALKHGYTRIATGHTASDQAETVLMRILSGSGVKGLSGIAPVLDGVVIRPLLDLTRAEVNEFCETAKIEFVEDETNIDQSFTRNRIRGSLLPLLERDYNPSVASALSRLSESARVVTELVERETDRARQNVVIEVRKGLASLHRKKFNTLAGAVRPALLENIMDTVAPQSRLDSVHISAIADASAGSGPSEIHLPDRVTVNAAGETITISRRKSVKNR